MPTAEPSRETQAPASAGGETPAPTAEPSQEPVKEPEPSPEPSPEPETVTEAPESNQEPAPAMETAEPAATEAPENTPEPAPEASQEPCPEPSDPPETAESAQPYSEKTEDTVLTVTGSAVDRDWYFSLAQLQSLGGTVSADYFSRGKDPQEITTPFVGIDLQYLFETVIGLSTYKKAVFTASDGYSMSYSRSAVNMSYIDETVPGSSLRMILAWTEGDSPCALRLVMGQQTAGEYNRTYWVRDVVQVELKAG